MRIAQLRSVNDKPALRVTDAPTTDLYDIRVKSLDSGMIHEAELVDALRFDNGNYIEIPGFGFERVAYHIIPIDIDCVAEWFVSSDQVPFSAWMEGRSKTKEMPPGEPFEESLGEPSEEPSEESSDSGTDICDDIVGVMRVQGRPMTVKEISMILNLNTPSGRDDVSRSLTGLEERGAVARAGTQATGGRPAALWEVVL